MEFENDPNLTLETVLKLIIEYFLFIS